MFAKEVGGEGTAVHKGGVPWVRILAYLLCKLAGLFYFLLLSYLICKNTYFTGAILGNPDIDTVSNVMPGSSGVLHEGQLLTEMLRNQCAGHEGSSLGCVHGRGCGEEVLKVD